jgi:hypothetical protein
VPAAELRKLRQKAAQCQAPQRKKNGGTFPQFLTILWQFYGNFQQFDGHFHLEILMKCEIR